MKVYSQNLTSKFFWIKNNTVLPIIVTRWIYFTPGIWCAGSCFIDRNGQWYASVHLSSNWRSCTWTPHLPCPKLPHPTSLLMSFLISVIHQRFTFLGLLIFLSSPLPLSFVWRNQLYSDNRISTIIFCLIKKL